MKEFVLDGAAMTSKEAIYQQLSRVFSFPTYFGHNLDAVWDLLMEEDEHIEIHFKHIALLVEHMDDYGEKLVKVFHNLEAINRHYTVHFYSGDMRSGTKEIKE